MKFLAIYTIEHDSLKEPKCMKEELYGSSLNAVIKQLKLGGRNACELKSKKETHWMDAQGGIHRLQLMEVPHLKSGDLC